MKFSTREDIDAPIEFVFDQLTDVSSLERAALRRGAQVERLDGGGPAAVGAAWRIVFEFRGKTREMETRVTGLDRPNEIVVTSVGSGIEGITTLELVPLAKGRTRLAFRQELKPTSLTARLLVQSLKLAKGQLQDRLKKRLDTMGRDIEGRHRAAT